MGREKLVHSFLLGEMRNAGKVTLSNTSKLIFNPLTQSVELRRQSFDQNAQKPVYSTDTDLTVTIAAINPKALRQWVGFCALPTPAKQPTDTELRYKLNDGTDDRYWNGASWAVAGAADWSTEAQVAANIGTYPATSQTLSVVVSLKTTDKYKTPSLYAIGVLMECELEYMLSLIEGSFLAELKEQLTLTYAVPTYGTGGTFLSLQELRRTYTISAVTAVYNHTTDPNHTTNLYSAYNADTKEITLSIAISTEHEAWIEVSVVPATHLNFSSQNYTEVASYPSVVADAFDIEGNVVEALAWVWSIDDYSAVARRRPHQMMFDFRIVLLAGDERELLQLMERMLQFGTASTLAWRDLDMEVTMQVDREARHSSRPSVPEVHTAEYRVTLRNVYFWLNPEQAETVAQNINFTLERLQK